MPLPVCQLSFRHVAAAVEAAAAAVVPAAAPAAATASQAASHQAPAVQTISAIPSVHSLQVLQPPLRPVGVGLRGLPAPLLPLLCPAR